MIHRRHGDAWEAGLKSCEARGPVGIVGWVPCTKGAAPVVFFASGTMTQHDGSPLASAAHGILACHMARQSAATNGFVPTPITR